MPSTAIPAATTPIARPAGRRGVLTILFRLVVGSARAIRRYFRQRAASACLHEMEPYGLRDIGLERAQIEAAVRGVPLDIGRRPPR
jgi:uncharacterized protein YjiS (DUF1127 family)